MTKSLKLFGIVTSIGTYFQGDKTHGTISLYRKESGSRNEPVAEIRVLLDNPSIGQKFDVTIEERKDG